MHVCNSQTISKGMAIFATSWAECQLCFLVSSESPYWNYKIVLVGRSPSNKMRRQILDIRQLLIIRFHSFFWPVIKFIHLSLMLPPRYSWASLIPAISLLLLVYLSRGAERLFSWLEINQLTAKKLWFYIKLPWKITRSHLNKQ